MSYKHHRSHQRRSAPDEGVRDGRQPPLRVCSKCGATDRDQHAPKRCPGRPTPIKPYPKEQGELLLIEDAEPSPPWNGEAAEP